MSLKKTEATGQSNNGLTTQRKETKTSRVQTYVVQTSTGANLDGMQTSRGANL